MNVIIKNIFSRKEKSINDVWLSYFIVFVLLISSSCDSILEVTDPDIVTPESLTSEEGLETLKAGSLGDLAVAMSGSSAGHGATTGLVVMNGLMSDEFDYSGTFPTRREGDTRNLQNTNSDIDRIYGNLHRARATAESTASLAAQFGGLTDIESEMQSIAGYTYVIFAESYCAGVPFGKAPADGGELEFGVPQTTQQMFEKSIEWFDTAKATAGSNSDLVNLATVGKARALLGLGQISEAANEASTVPTSFEYDIEHSNNSLRQENGIYTMTTVRRQFSVANGKGGNGIMYRDAMDPRVTWNGGADFGQDDITLYYNQLKYTSASDPVVLSSGIEARLIEAEAAVDVADNSTVENIHNALRSSIGLEDLDLVGMTQQQLRTVHFEERAFWLYATGHRHGDLRRLVRVYGEDVSAVFPSGAYFKGGEYDSNVTFPVPQSEANNPNYKACLDTNP